MADLYDRNFWGLIADYGLLVTSGFLAWGTFQLARSTRRLEQWAASEFRAARLPRPRVEWEECEGPAEDGTVDLTGRIVSANDIPMRVLSLVVEGGVGVDESLREELVPEPFPTPLVETGNGYRFTVGVPCDVDHYIHSVRVKVVVENPEAGVSAEWWCSTVIGEAAGRWAAEIWSPFVER